jgi:hypothetical protein
MKQHLGYSDEEIELFRKNPHNARVMATAPDMRQRTIVFEVVESEGCNSKHEKGTRFFFTGDGNLITKMAPPRVCAYALPVMTQAIFGMQELWYAGVDPSSLTFKRGGWGHIVLEASLVDREKARKLFEQG